MVWNPRKKDLEVISDLIAARASITVIADAVGTTPDCFVAWRQRCLTAANDDRIMWERPAAPVVRPGFKA
jgi:hypothetical protein